MKILAKILILFVPIPLSSAWATVPANLRQFAEEHVTLCAQAFHVQEELVAAVITVESGWNPYAVSNKGAVGLMQLMPETARRFGVQDRFDIAQNICGGTAYIARLMSRFNGDLRLVVAAYLVGESPILLHGLAYCSREAFVYVSRVAQRYRAMRQDVLATSKKRDSWAGE
jgi:soluble lytic murein transglycosylase-like protein